MEENNSDNIPMKNENQQQTVDNNVDGEKKTSKRRFSWKMIAVAVAVFIVCVIIILILSGVFAAKNERPQADEQCLLGSCYYYGEGVEQDYAKAVERFRKAAEQGDALAQFNLGNCYDNGQGVEQNILIARKWYRKAADH